MTDSITPLVSVVMATFNEAPATIKESINSIIDQTLYDLELLIIDDSTEQDTIESINSFVSDKRVIVIRSENKVGFVNALNIGLKRARGKYIARMDGDDISQRDRFRLQTSFMELNPQYSVVGGAMAIMNEEGIITNKRSYPASSLKLRLWSIFRSPLAHPTVMMKREIVDLGYLYDTNYCRAEDLELWLRLVKNGYEIYNLPDILLNYRISNNFIKKRSGQHHINNFKARYKNFTWRYPIISILSLLVSGFYFLIPGFIKKLIYSIENY